MAHDSRARPGVVSGSTIMMNKNLALLAGSIALASSFYAMAQGTPLKGNPEAARTKVSMCIGCHGIPMYHTAFPEVYHVPLIAGQSPQYIVQALEEYRSGDRSHPSMRAIAKSLSDQDIADLAAYYGTSTDEALR